MPPSVTMNDHKFSSSANRKCGPLKGKEGKKHVALLLLHIQELVEPWIMFFLLPLHVFFNIFVSLVSKALNHYSPCCFLLHDLVL